MPNTASTPTATAVEARRGPREYRRAVWELQEAEHLVDYARDRLQGLDEAEVLTDLRAVHRGLGRAIGMVVRQATREDRADEVRDLVVGRRPWLHDRIAEGGAR